MNKKRFILIVSVLLVVVVLGIATSYAMFTFNVTKNTNFKLVIGKLELKIDNTQTEDKIIMENTVPTKDSEGITQEGYTFTITNTGTIDSYYTVYLDDILLEDYGERLDNSYVKLNILNHKTQVGSTNKLSNYTSDERKIASGILKTGEDITYTIKMWVDYNAGNDAQNKYYATQIRVVGEQVNAVGYKEEILNGTDPVLTDNLVPIIIAEDGTVTRANIEEQWYSYENKRWANAVVLKNDKIYKNGETILEEEIESYFVWIPKYSYQLWDLGNYSGITVMDSSKVHTIPIKFGLTNTSDTNTGECTTHSVSGESGNCKVGDYMTHPAFLAFDSTGFWVGKFETGYDGAISNLDAQIESSDSSKIIIKSNSYSWRPSTIGNMFKASYDYLREDESHMMKNTEWGAVAYLQHSAYGSQTNVRLNNNSNYVTGYSAANEPTVGWNDTNVEGNIREWTDPNEDGEYTINYFNPNSVLSSTTGNYSGIYDMSGGNYEYVMGYEINAPIPGGESKITDFYSDFFTNSNWDKYYDKYVSNNQYDYSNRILGDAIGEMGPIGQDPDPDGSLRKKTGWYLNRIEFVVPSQPWFQRGCDYKHGNNAGVFASYHREGSNSNYNSFRIVLAPTK